MHISFLHPPNPLKWLLLAHDHGCDVRLKVTDRSVHTIFRGSLTIFLYYGSDRFLLSFLLSTAQATGKPKLCSQILDQYSFQSLEQVSEKKKSTTFSQGLLGPVRWLNGQRCLPQTRRPEDNTWDPHGEGREPILTSFPLTSILVHIVHGQRHCVCRINILGAWLISEY